MKYSIVEKIDAGERTAWSKARADAAAIAVDEGYVPVSYTHLDVYKRQL